MNRYFCRRLNLVKPTTRFNFKMNNSRDLNTSCITMEKAVREIQSNPFFEKYSQKIAKLQTTSPEDFLKCFTQAKEHQKSEPGGHSFTPVAKQARADLPRGAYAFAPQKKLSSVMKTELLANKSRDEIEFIWNLHFTQKDAVCGVIPADLYDKIYDNSAKYPAFLFPLPRDQGYEFILTQFASHEIHFTSLINYQAYQENAPECLTVVHFPDLKQNKGIVLMQGEFDKKIINAFDARFLVNQVQLYYSGADPAKLHLLEKFHKQPDQFKHMDLIHHIENIDLSVIS